MQHLTESEQDIGELVWTEQCVQFPLPMGVYPLHRFPHTCSHEVPMLDWKFKATEDTFMEPAHRSQRSLLLPQGCRRGQRVLLDIYWAEERLWLFLHRIKDSISFCFPEQLWKQSKRYKLLRLQECVCQSRICELGNGHRAKHSQGPSVALELGSSSKSTI